ncbi:tripartite tricarboxylate transporter permease [Thalassobacillus sp. CUG 92003]|uniref:tripartite tricarboxylate transporter permease n=1 Tax=Thalassobacillus sp. CUG 92003 TaxID=2736641 RepID=UPI0015E6A0FC|nr:tripartite tricarboxylate transporter permease [Thalassobacillus sp. CUG 92003]
MANLEQLISALATVATPLTIAWIFLGVVIGILFGAAPGLTATTGVAIFTPVTFYLPFQVSMALLLGIFAGGFYAGSIPAILIKTPGAPGNAATILDGYPMAQSGKPGQALGYSVIASWFGGTLSAFILMLLAPTVGAFTLKFGPPEYFALGILGLACVAGVSEGSLLKGAAGALFGMILATIGMDPIAGLSRFTFGSTYLMGGVALIPALIGLFAVSEVLSKTEIVSEGFGKLGKVKNVLPKFKEFWIYKWTMLKGALMGSFIGALPGTGPTIASWISYNEAKRASKQSDKFGKGSEEGIIASESANNAVTGGALLPLLTLGIPGDTVTAVLLGALMIKGVTPGPTLITDNYSLVAEILWILVIANVFLLIVGILGSKLFPKLLKTPMPIMLPLIIVMCVTGGYAVNNSVFDVKVIMFLGVLGFFFMKFGFPIPPIVLGLVLGPIIEKNLIGSLVTSDMNPLIFVTRPISGTILALTVLFVYFITKQGKSNSDAGAS